MEELQDAIEDAQYVNAISSQDDGPRPVLHWEIPSEEQLEAWKATKQLTLEFFLSSAIGLFLFSSFLKDNCDDYIRINFVEDVIRWRRLTGRIRIQMARLMVETYFAAPKMDADGNVIRPLKSEIDEYELERQVSEVPDLERLYSENRDSSNGKCLLGLDGPVRDDIFSVLCQVEQARAAYRKGKTSSDPTALVEQYNATPRVETENPVETGSTVKFESNATDEEYANRPTNVESPTHKAPAAEGHKDADEKTTQCDVHCDTDTQKASVLSIHLSDSFFNGPEAVVVEGLRRQYWDNFLLSGQYKKLLHFLWYQDRKVVPEDFFVMRVLGRGGFGLVTACKKGASGKLYAMKVMNKRRIKIKKSEQLALNEREVLAAVESPFVVNLKYSFHSKDDVYLILDLMTGGDLGYHLHQKGRFPKKECLYYSARIMLGLQALHDKGYVYRDLKPENCLLADDGRVKITDLGLATVITPTLHGAAGTRGYWAPEMLRRNSKGKRMTYDHTVDWFSFGCCLAEFISGKNPFRSESALNFGVGRGKESKEKAIDCATLEMDPVFDPNLFETDAADLCRQLLDKNEKTRLGFNGCHEIMKHPWFKEYDWGLIITDRMKPPFVPPKDVNAASQSEIGNFAQDKAYHETHLDSKDESYYENWDWTNPRAFSAEVIEFMIYERETGEPLLPAIQNSSCCCTIS